jgi:hypothetical protein
MFAKAFPIIMLHSGKGSVVPGLVAGSAKFVSAFSRVKVLLTAS